MINNRRLFLPLALMIAAALVACGTLLVSPQSFSEKLALGYATHTAVLTAATNALNAHEISSADAEQVLKIATESRRVLDGAKLASEAGDVKTAEGRLALGMSVLVQLQAFLRERQH